MRGALINEGAAYGPQLPGRVGMRTESIIGDFDAVPKVGQKFVIVNNDPLNPAGNGRIVWTSEVQQITLDGGDWIFVTESGTRYRLIYSGGPILPARQGGYM